MSEPEEVRFACIGCGAMNPAGAEACAGCGHRFAGPGGGPIPGPGGGPIPGPEPGPPLAIPEMHFRDDDLYKPGRPVPEASLLGCLGKVIGVTFAVVATLVAFVVACFATCMATNAQALTWPILGGLAAAGLVAAFSIWVASFSREG
jgi:hypothetical protein